MNKRLNIYFILAICAYIGSFGNYYWEKNALRLCFELGKSTAKRDKKAEANKSSISSEKLYVFPIFSPVNLVPKDNQFPERTINSMDGNEVQFAKEKITVDFYSEKFGTLSLLIIEMLVLTLEMMFAGILIILPIQIYATLNRMRKNYIFDKVNLVSFRMIGIELCILFLLDAARILLTYYIQKQSLALDNYDIVMESFSPSLLVSGLVLLIFNEVIQNGLLLKKENDLTV